MRGNVHILETQKDNTLSVQSSTCQAGVNSCQVGLRSAPLPRARAWYGMVEVCEGAPVAVSGWVLTDRHDVRPCAASSLLRAAEGGPHTHLRQQITA